MPLPADRSWQHAWLRLHLVMRDLIATPWAGNEALIKREIARCVELRDAMMRAGWFN